MFRRDAYDAVGGYDEHGSPAEDHDLWLRMAEVVEIATIPDVLLRYRRMPTSLSIRHADHMTRVSIDVSTRAIERATGRRPSERLLEGLRAEEATLTCDDARSVLDVVVPVYAAVRRACARRGLSTRTLPGQLAAVLAAGGVRRPDGAWCRGGVAHLVRRHPQAGAAILRDQLAARTRRVTPAASEARRARD
jgi:hypothetical protein